MKHKISEGLGIFEGKDLGKEVSEKGSDLQCLMHSKGGVVSGGGNAFREKTDMLRSRRAAIFSDFDCVVVTHAPACKRLGGRELTMRVKGWGEARRQVVLIDVYGPLTPLGFYCARCGASLGCTGKSLEPW